MAQPVQVRPISNDEGNRLLRIVRRGTGSVVSRRRAQVVLLSAQRMPVAKIAEGVVDDISHEGLRALLRDEDVSFQAAKTYKASTDLTRTPRPAACGSCTPSPTAWSSSGRPTQRWWSAWTSSGR